MDLYTACICLTILIVIVFTIHIKNVSLVVGNIRSAFVIVGILIAVAAISEWLTIKLNGTSNDFEFIHKIIKCVEFSVAPTIPLFFCRIVGFRLFGKIRIGLDIVVIANSILEIISIFNGMIFSMDSNNTYVRGPLYPIYIAIYLITILIFVCELLKFSIDYLGRGIIVVILMFIILAFSLAIQTIWSSVKIDWISIGLIYALLYSYYSDVICHIDELTGCYNRASYEIESRRIDYNTTILMCDVDHFKSINDSYGHNSGDIALKVVGKSLTQVFSKYASCYRVGGDEFVVFVTKKGQEYIDTHFRSIEDWVTSERLRLSTALLSERQKIDYIPDVSMGFASINKDCNFDCAVQLADAMLYEEKKEKSVNVKKD